MAKYQILIKDENGKYDLYVERQETTTEVVGPSGNQTVGTGIFADVEYETDNQDVLEAKLIELGQKYSSSQLLAVDVLNPKQDLIWT